MPEDLEDNYTWSIAWYKPKQSCHFRLDIAIKSALAMKGAADLFAPDDWMTPCLCLPVYLKETTEPVSEPVEEEICRCVKGGNR